MKHRCVKKYNEADVEHAYLWAACLFPESKAMREALPFMRRELDKGKTNVNAWYDKCYVTNLVFEVDIEVTEYEEPPGYDLDATDWYVTLTVDANAWMGLDAECDVEVNIKGDIARYIFEDNMFDLDELYREGYDQSESEHEEERVNLCREGLQ